MIKRDELLRTEEYWFETLQNDIYRMVAEYIQKEGMNQTQLAEQLGVSKGYISQIMNGNFNYTLKKMIELSLALKKAPAFEFKNLEQYIQEDRQKRFEMEYKQYFILITRPLIVNISSGETANSVNIQQSGETYVLEAA
jgi:transcriptional regulator with XRE-family HTH domain